MWITTVVYKAIWDPCAASAITTTWEDMAIIANTDNSALTANMKSVTSTIYCTS